MKKILMLSVAVAACAVPGWANMPTSAITKMIIPVYGVYTSADPLCATGLVATIPLTATPKNIDFAAGTSFGKGKTPKDGINCVVILMKSSVSTTWAAGTYTGTTNFGSNQMADSGCNAGDTEDITNAGTFTCQATLRPTLKAIYWPDQVKADMEALGLTRATNCNEATASTISPLYLSTYSKCTGITDFDNAIGGTCAWSLNTDITAEGYRSNYLHLAPTSDGDPNRGIKITGLAAGIKKFKFIADLTYAVGGTPCQMQGPPKFSFVSGQ